MPRYDTAGDIINSAAVECGLTAVSDPFASTDPAFIQLVQLLTNTGRELLGLYQWNRFVKTHSITTVVPPDTGDYDLPDDFAFMIDQTGWTPTNAGLGLPLGGPLSEQDWAYLVNTNLASSTIYVSFKMSQGQFQVLPQPPPTGIDIIFSYISRYWVALSAAPTVAASDKITASDNVVFYEPILITKFLKLRFLESKGFDTTAASQQFQSVFMQWTGKDVSAPVLNAARMRVFPYLGWRNIPETNFGLP
jgi:hypothetical protein